MSAPALVRVTCPTCGRTAGILAGAVAWCWGIGLGHKSRRMVAA